MSNVNANKIGERLSQCLLKAVWRQWRSLGVELSDQHRDAQSAVDPEALLLATTILLDEEPRLRDVLASWLTTRSSTLSVQRVRNLAKRFPATATALLPTLAMVAFERGKDHRWRPLIPVDREPPALNDRKKDLIGTRTHRPPGAIMVQVRMGMGVGVKADVLAYLLCVSRSGQDWASISAIQDALGYTKVSIGRVTEEMRAANFISGPGSVDRHTRAPKMYRTEIAGWTQVLGLNGGMPEWASWDEHFLFITKFLHWASTAVDRNVVDYALATKIRALIEEHPRALASSRFSEERAPADIDEWLGYFDRRLTNWENWLEQTG